MRSEGSRGIELSSKQFFRFVRIFLTAIVALNLQAIIQARRRIVGVGFCKKNFVGIEEILAAMKAVVLAQHHPEILTRISHIHPQGP
jgi:hypothetical protein